MKVLKVHTQNRKGKPRRTKFQLGHTKDWKKAIVTLGSPNIGLISFKRDSGQSSAGQLSAD